MAPADLRALVGGTPVIRLPGFEKAGVRIYAKLEGWNPTGSIKDRTAAALVQEALETGALRPGMTVLEASSGNTGIGLAMVCALMGHPLRIVMSRKASRERVSLLRAYGAEFELTSVQGGADEALRRADQIAAAAPERFCRVSQHRSLATVGVHRDTTGVELVSQIPEPIDTLVLGIGTGATLRGVASRAREHYPQLQAVGVQPDSRVNRQEGLRNVDLATPPPVFERAEIDQILTVSDAEAREATRRLVRTAGVLGGISSGSALAGIEQLVAAGRRGVFATILPDRGDRYLSTSLFADEPSPSAA